MASPPADPGRTGGSFLTKYFLVILFGFACLSLMLNSRFTHHLVHDPSIVESQLKASVQSFVLKKNHVSVHNTQKRDDAVDQDESDNDAASEANDNDVDESFPKNMITKKELANPHSNRVAGLNCKKFGGPSEEKAQEMVYWEDIPSDAKWVSPFHSKHRNAPIQYLTFEPDRGGWNNIR